MKTLILVRHAKSDWPENVDDFDRPLTELGKINAAKMAEFLKSTGVTIDSFISSPAKRAKHTCELFSTVFNKTFQTNEKLYRPSESNCLSVIFDVDDAVNSLALFSHNNGISNFANSMSDDVFMFPTCGVAGFQIETDSWSDFENAKKKLVFFYEPKKI